MKWTRTTKAIPGYDCRDGRCQHKQKGNHGIDGGQWIFAVQGDPVAVELVVLTSFYPESVTSPLATQVGWPAARHRLVGYVGFHRETRFAGDVGRPCSYFPDGQCYGYDTSYAQADEFLSLLPETLDGASEELWQKLEAIALRFAQEVTG